MKKIAIAAAVAIAVPLAIGSAAPAEAYRATATCTTAKGVLKATRVSSPNGRNTTLHQIFWNTNKAVNGGSKLDTIFHFHHVTQPAGAIPGTFKKGAGQSIVFQTRGTYTPAVTVNWRGKKPASLNQYSWANCTIQP